MLRLYRFLLRLYPAAYRREFGDEMACVFLQAQSGLNGSSRTARASFNVREIFGLLKGAALCRLRPTSGLDELVPFGRFTMRSGFRFPRSTVLLMCVILAVVLLAIGKAHTIQVEYGHAGAAAWSMPWALVFLAALACVTVALAWGILFALRRSGLHRLSNVETWPQQHSPGGS
jgi:hypothetical protein